MRINIAYGVSTNFWLDRCRLSAFSILFNAKENEEYHFYIISEEICEEEKEKFYRLNTVKKSNFHFLVANPKDFEGAVHDYLGISASYRLKLPSMTDIDKVLYLDSDTLVVQNITELYKRNIEDYYLAAVEDKCNSMMLCRIKGLQNIFFNSGVMLMNLKAFRKDNIEEKIFEKLRKNSEYTDQDVINDICRYKILSLPLKYNIVPTKGILEDDSIYHTRREEYFNAVAEPVIIHPPFYNEFDNIIILNRIYNENYEKIMR